MSKNNKISNLIALNGVRFDNNGRLDVKLDDAQNIKVLYDPTDYPFKQGVWTYDSTKIQVIYKSGEMLRFKAKVAGSSTITFTPDNNKNVSASCIVNATANSIQSLSLSPKDEAVGLGAEFAINVNYTPANADFTPQWSFDQSSLMLMSKSTKDVGYFKAVSPRASAGKITCTVDSLSAVNTYHIGDNPPKVVHITPAPDVVNVGQTFRLNVTFEPSNADSAGIWVYDETYFSGSFSSLIPGLATFTALKSTGENDFQTISFHAADGVFAGTSCQIQYAPASSIELTPSQTTVRAGDGFYIDVAFSPDGTKLTGEWSYDENYFEMLYLDDEPNRVFFNAIVSTMGKKSKISFAQGNVQSNIVEMVVDYSVLQDITFEPASIGLDPSKPIKAGDAFAVHINYHPDTAEHICTWNLDTVSDYIMKSVGDYDTATFIALKSTVDVDGGVISLPVTSGYIEKSIPCKFDYSDLKSISFDQTNATIAYSGDPITINVTYVPDTAKHSIIWTYDDKYRVLEKNDDKIVLTPDSVKVLPDTKTTITANSTIDPSITVSCKCLIAYDILNSVSISPDSGTWNVGDSFPITISYTPQTSQHTGLFTWSYDSQYVDIDWDKSSGDTAYFKALKPTPKTGTSIINMPINGSTMASNPYVCHISYDPIKSVTLSPSKSEVKQGESTYIAVTYDPDNALHSGAWSYDFDKLALISDNTSFDGASFYAIRGVPAGDTEIKFTYGDGQVVTNTCTVLYSPLVNCIVSPSVVTSNRDYDQYFDIIYIPNNTLHDGKWDYDHSAFEMLSDSTVDGAHFKVLPNSSSGTYTLTYTPTGIDGQTTQSVPVTWIIRD